MAGAITGTSFLAASPTSYAGANTQLSPAVQQLWSKEILFSAMPILRFEQFAVKKTELGVSPGLTIHFMRYNNLPAAAQLVEGVRMQSVALTASQFDITVAEQGFAVAVTELLLNASFDDVMASASRLLGRNMALYLDGSARDTLRQASSLIYGYNKPALASAVRTPLSPYDHGVPATGNGSGQLSAGNFALTARSSRTSPRPWPPRTCRAWATPTSASCTRTRAASSATTPSTSRSRSTRHRATSCSARSAGCSDCVFIETTQVWNDLVSNLASGTGSALYYDAIFIGDNAFGHAISLPVELRDAGILDYGREHGLAWYAIWGLGLITDQSCLIARTN